MTLRFLWQRFEIFNAGETFSYCLLFKPFSLGLLSRRVRNKKLTFQLPHIYYVSDKYVRMLPDLERLRSDFGLIRSNKLTSWQT